MIIPAERASHGHLLLPFEDGLGRRAGKGVAVWSLLVFGVPEVGAPRQVWRTGTIDLLWEEGDWRVDGWVAKPGPAPLLDGTAAVASMEEIAEVLAWPQSPGGGG